MVTLSFFFRHIAFFVETTDDDRVGLNEPVSGDMMGRELTVSCGCV